MILPPQVGVAQEVLGTVSASLYLLLLLPFYTHGINLDPADLRTFTHFIPPENSLKTP